MIVSLSGSTGFIGQALLQKMQRMGWTVREIHRESFLKPDQEFLEELIEGSDVVINLAGAPVSLKWTAACKQQIIDSRVNTTRKISSAVNSTQQKPALFISFSAIGIYDSLNTHSEASTAYSGSFLSSVCRAWEQEAQNSISHTRTVIFRTGLVLGDGGGALKKMYFPFSIGAGGKIGNGKQPVSFIHIDDLVEAVLFTIENTSVSGIVNAVSPCFSFNAEFSDVLAKVLGQPCWLTVPAFALRMVYGEGAQILLEGQKVLPEKLELAGFRFKYPTIQNALIQIYG